MDKDTIAVLEGVEIVSLVSHQHLLRHWFTISA